MLTRKNQLKPYPLYCLHCFLFSLMLFSLVFMGCGVQKNLLPKRNAMLSNLPDKSKETYLELARILNDGEKEQLENEINTLSSISELITLIDKKFCNQRLYIDLLQVFPVDQSTKLKNEVKKCINENERSQVIASKLPQELKQLDDHTYKKLFKLPINQRQNILAHAIKKEGIYTNIAIISPTLVDQSNDAVKLAERVSDLLPESPLRIDEMVNQIFNKEVAAEEEKSVVIDNGLQEDGWGVKLPLIGIERKDFLKVIIDFSQADQKKLKQLFALVDQDSIENFISVYHMGFSVKERPELLSTIIYLYKVMPTLTVKLCNDPESVSFGERFKLFNKVSRGQLSLLTKLDGLLSAA